MCSEEFVLFWLQSFVKCDGVDVVYISRRTSVWLLAYTVLSEARGRLVGSGWSHDDLEACREFLWNVT